MGHHRLSENTVRCVKLSNINIKDKEALLQQTALAHDSLEFYRNFTKYQLNMIQLLMICFTFKSKDYYLCFIINVCHFGHDI